MEGVGLDQLGSTVGSGSSTISEQGSFDDRSITRNQLGDNHPLATNPQSSSTKQSDRPFEFEDVAGEILLEVSRVVEEVHEVGAVLEMRSIGFEARVCQSMFSTSLALDIAEEGVELGPREDGEMDVRPVLISSPFSPF